MAAEGLALAMKQALMLPMAVGVACDSCSQLLWRTRLLFISFRTWMERS